MIVRRLVLALTLSSSMWACGPDVHEKPRTPVCPSPPEPPHQSLVVGTIGKMHMVESRYALARFGDVIAAFKPDLVLVGVRVEPFREDRLEDASFEMTYVRHLAKTRGIPVEPIDWREADPGARSSADADSSDAEKRETEVLRAPRMYSFEQANSDELSERVLLATSAASRHRADPVGARRRGWLEQLTAAATTRYARPKRVLAFVDVFDRPVVDATLHALGYVGRSPIEVVSKSKEVLADVSVPSDLLSLYQAQLTRARERERAEGISSTEASFWAERSCVLDAVVAQKAACCVALSALEPRGP